MHRLLLSSVIAVSATFVAGCGGFKVFPLIEAKIASEKENAELVARGEYLFHGAAHCSACHTTAEQGAAIKGGDRPAPTGGHVWKMGPIGTLTSPNITPHDQTGVGKWTDEDIARVIKYAQRPDGTTSVFMRFALGKIADDDVKALVSYIRTLQPVEKQQQPHEVGFLGKMIFGDVAPRENTVKESVPMGATVERGRYLALGPAVCVGCHSETDGFEVKAGREFVGASEPMPSEFEDDPNMYRAPNLTPDATGISGKWTEEQFIARFKEGRQHKGSPMPWGNYQNLQDDDIKALWLFLKSLKPVQNEIPLTVVPK